MFVVCNEAQATQIFSCYKNVAAFTTTKKKGVEVGGRLIPYETLPFNLSDDDINACVNGDVSVKKLIKKTVKMLYKPKACNLKYGSAGLGITMLIHILTNDRRNKNGLPVIALIVDDEEKARNKVIAKYLNGVLEAFGLRLLPFSEVKKLFRVSEKDIKHLLGKKLYKKYKKQGKQIHTGKRNEYSSSIRRKLKGNRVIADRVIEFSAGKKSGCMLRKRGAQLKELLTIYYSLELKRMSMIQLGITNLNDSNAEACIKILFQYFTNTNLKRVPDGEEGDIQKAKNGAMVKAYKQFADVLKLINQEEPLKLPKVKFGQIRKANDDTKEKFKKLQKKLKKGKISKKKFNKWVYNVEHTHPAGARMNKAKFKKFFMKKKNRGLLILLYAHMMTVSLGLEVGTKDYNAQMKEACEIFTPGFAKLYTAAANAYRKDREKPEKTEA